MSELKPRGRPEVHTRDTSRQRMLYDASTNTFHALNETAEYIWTLCDGRHTLQNQLPYPRLKLLSFQEIPFLISTASC